VPVSFSHDAWQRIAPLYGAILDLPFNRELTAGTLSRERFTFYLLQDAHYLTYFARALAVTAARAPDNDALVQFAGSAREAVLVERALHEGFFKQYGISPALAAATEASPTCAHYTHFLLAVAHNAPYEVAVATLLPCFWIYWEVGKHLYGIAKADNPYRPWIDTYADEAFADGVRKVLAIGDQMAEAASPAMRDQMFRAFVRAFQLEWMFWDSAYRLERWPV
jgi:thiaminase (transcriptional activator TenA)